MNVSRVPPEVDDLAHRLRSTGLSYDQIAAELDRLNISIPGVGMRWHNSGALRAVKRAEARNRSAKPAEKQTDQGG